MKTIVGNMLFTLFWIFAGLTVIRILFSALTKTEWWEKHICRDFPHEHECFDCPKTTCEGCEVPESGRPVLFIAE